MRREGSWNCLSLQRYKKQYKDRYWFQQTIDWYSKSHKRKARMNGFFQFWQARLSVSCQIHLSKRQEQRLTTTQRMDFGFTEEDAFALSFAGSVLSPGTQPPLIWIFSWSRFKNYFWDYNIIVSVLRIISPDPSHATPCSFKFSASLLLVIVVT